MKYTSVRCLHDTQNDDTDIIVDDHYPLSNLEIDELLEESLHSSCPSSQQVRLNQAIAGCECPRPISGEYVRKEIAVGNIFIDGYRNSGWTKEQRRQIYALCNG